VAADLGIKLKDLGYTVLLATDGEAASTLAASANPDMGLFDIRMPKKDGLAAAAEVYNQYGVPVVILSAYAEPELVAQAQKAGVFGYLIKPVQEDQLRAAIEVAWSRYILAAKDKAEAESLKKRLEDRRIIEQAKWKLVSSKGMTEPDAMTALQKKARSMRAPLAEVAMAVMHHGLDV
jgi:response regulator NasT